jgi:hypothetical protein
VLGGILVDVSANKICVAKNVLFHGMLGHIITDDSLEHLSFCFSRCNARVFLLVFLKRKKNRPRERGALERELFSEEEKRT